MVISGQLPTINFRTMDTDNYPIHEAIQKGNENIAIQLLREKPKAVIATDSDGRTPLHWAISASQPAVFDEIVAASPYKRWREDCLEAEDALGWTALLIAIAGGNEEMVEKLLEAGADVNAVTGNGTTALHLAVSKLPSLLSRLLEAGAQFRGDRSGTTPLHRAAARGSKQVSHLIDAKGRTIINKVDSDGWTALHHAMAEGNGETAVELIKKGADPSIKSTAGETAADVAPPKVREYVYSCCDL